ncbi:MAG: hypothetical protein WKF89_01695 [Chitinophagaceae bacterium]
MSASSVPGKDANAAVVRNADKIGVPKPVVGDKGMKLKPDNLTVSKMLDSLRLANKADSVSFARKADSLLMANRADSMRVARVADSLRLAMQAENLRAKSRSDSLRMALRSDSLRLANKADSLRIAKNAESLRLANKADSLRIAGKADSLRIAAKPRISNALYSDNAAEAHYVVLVLDKVDPVYATEARNAFNRYHRESYRGRNIEVTTTPLNDDTRFVLLSGFENASAAIDYVSSTRKLTETEIIPWLTPQKYSFIIITGLNLDVLKSNKDLESYRKFLKQVYPTKF